MGDDPVGITGQVRVVATFVRVTEVTARAYLYDETIQDLARRLLPGVVGARPGAIPGAPEGWPVSSCRASPACWANRGGSALMLGSRVVRAQPRGCLHASPITG